MILTAPVATFQAADKGTQINLTQTNGISLTGGAGSLVVTNPSGIDQTYSCTISVDGTYAYYVTTGTEFPTAGTYNIQFIFTSSGRIQHSPVVAVLVLANT